MTTSALSTAPRVTVIVPVYNRARYIGATVESVLAQRFTNFELLLIDDGSTDDSVAIIRSYRDPRVRLVCNLRNLGIPYTRNTAVAQARGEYVAMLDSDDIAVPERLSQQVRFLDQHLDYAVVGSWVGILDDRHKRVRKIGLLPVSAADVHARLLFHCSLSQSSVMARTEIVRAARYRGEFVVCSDFDLWVRLASTYKLANLPQFLVHRRLHSTRVTASRAQLVREKKLAIFRSQLATLGVRHTDADLERHFLLLRMNRSSVPLGHEYLRWAEQWLQGLLTANRSSASYPDHVFHHVVGEIWAAVCWQAARQLGWRICRIYWRSPLRQSLRPSLQKYLALRVFGEFPN